MTAAFQSEAYGPARGGVHPGLYRPPAASPPTTGYFAGARSAASMATSPLTYDSPITATKRKRPGPTPHSSHAHPRLSTSADADSGAAILSSPARDSSSSLRTYRLAGQINTPGAEMPDALGDSIYSDSDYRRALGTKRSRDALDSTHDAVAEPRTSLFDAAPQVYTPSRGWGSFAVTAIGGVVGRVWEFCTAGAFKGFHAGSGKSFEVRSDGTMRRLGNDDEYHHIPGRYPQADYDDDCDPPAYDECEKSDSRASTPSRGALKRRQTEQSDDLGRNWVMVREPDSSVMTAEKDGDNGSSTPRRAPIHVRPSSRSRNHVPSSATNRRISTPHSRLPTSTAATTPRRASAFPGTSPALTVEPRPSSASFASPRSPSPTKRHHNQHNRTSSSAASPSGYTSSSQPISHSRRHSTAVSPAPSLHRRANSNASVAAPHRGSMSGLPGSAGKADGKASPRLDPEAKRLAARRKREDRETDAQMASFNKRLQEMIRQGQEALGSTIVVEGGGDGRWEDED